MSANEGDTIRREPVLGELDWPNGGTDMARVLAALGHWALQGERGERYEFRGFRGGLRIAGLCHDWEAA